MEYVGPNIKNNVYLNTYINCNGSSAGFDLFYLCSDIRAVTNCESLVKDFYSNLGLQYRDSSSEDEASQPTEIIEIPDEDDDVLSIDSGKR